MAQDIKKGRKPAKPQQVESLFHRRRQRFVILPSGIAYASESDARSDLEWCAQERWISGFESATFGRLTRGFVDHRGIVAYRGPSFAHMGVSLDLYPVLHLLQEDLSLPSDTPVWLGAQPSENGYSLDGTRYVGTLGDLMRKYIVRRMRPVSATEAQTAA